MFRRILHATDFSRGSTRALAHAVSFAQRYHAELHVVHALTLHAYDPTIESKAGMLLAEALDRIEDDLAERAGTFFAPVASGRTLTPIFRRGVEASEVILGIAAELGADLVVMGTRGISAARQLLLGSVAERVARASTCPVLVVGGDDEPAVRLKHIVVPVDFSQAGTGALVGAGALARDERATLHALHVFEDLSPPPFYENLLRVDADLRARGERALREHVAAHVGEGVEFSVHLREGRPAAEIAAFGDELAADLVVMARQGHAAMEPPALGSVTGKVLRRASRPVLICPHGPCGPQK